MELYQVGEPPTWYILHQKNPKTKAHRTEDLRQAETTAPVSSAAVEGSRINSPSLFFFNCT